MWDHASVRLSNLGLGAMTHQVNGGSPCRKARSRAEGSIGVSPVSRNDGWISANGCAAKLALQALDHRPAPQSGTQAGRLCYLGLGVMPPVGCRVVSRRRVGGSAYGELRQLFEKAITNALRNSAYPYATSGQSTYSFR